MAKKVEGMVPIQITPFDGKGNVDEKSYRRLVKYMVDNGVTAILTMGDISESRALTEAQKKRVCEITVEEVKGKVPVIQGVMTTSTNMQIKLAKDAAEAGADGLLVPYTAALVMAGRTTSEDAMYSHFYKVANAVPDLDIMVYDSTMHGEISLDLFKKLAKNISNVKYAKETVSPTKVSRVVDALGERIGLFAGIDTFLVPWLQLGCVGGTNSTPNVIPMHARKIYEAALKKDWEEVNKNWFKCWPLIMSFYGYGFPSTITLTYKHALYWLGVFDNVQFIDTDVPPSEEGLKATRKALVDLGMNLVR